MTNKAAKKGPKPSLKWVKLTDVTDALKLYERAMKESPEQFPIVNKEPIERVRHHFFHMMQSAGFMGLMVKKGRKPVGCILGQIQNRVLGRPRAFFYIHFRWINPEERGKGYGKMLREEFAKELRRMEITQWVTNVVSVDAEALADKEKLEGLKPLYTAVCGEV